ncbi:YceI family protein [Roseovarius rhodophyticola]|uniref:YceI family protein n=1 Tax=Roseovarius rhodophyticola TaxID=3080827 RepID=A0ABZ2TGX2_9RHOB|nr:YceI family protein [Roseovarius sp. W115]MDV2928599.1 YceI family protein [Roseovarius sp. W115]
MKHLATAGVLALATTASAAFAAPEKYTLDASHSQVMFSYNHFGFSTTYNMFSGFEGEIVFDQNNPENSSVSVAMPVKSLFTGWEARFQHFMAEDFFGAQDGDMITFTSTAIEVTGDNTADITGDLTINDVTKSVVLDAKLNQVGQNPLNGKDWAGFDATTVVKRSDFNLGAFAPNVSDELDVRISIEAGKAE